METYDPASYQGGILTLCYARAQDWNRDAVVAPLWLQSSEAAVTLGPGEEREVERIPAQLRRFS